MVQRTRRIDPEIAGTGVPYSGYLTAFRVKNTVRSIQMAGPHSANQAQRSPLRKPVRQIARPRRALMNSEASFALIIHSTN
jgi:hypothetical protein